jgi:hypothetical protein
MKCTTAMTPITIHIPCHMVNSDVGFGEGGSGGIFVFSFTLNFEF